ncbi:MAG: winged helix-turn-helix domain-containing protein [Methylohalobius sp.]
MSDKKQGSAKSSGAAKQTPAKPAAESKPTVETTRGEEIGLAAGKIWHCLDRVGEASSSKLEAETGLNSKEVQRAIGWLAREGKLIIERDGRTEVFRLA